jgi:hypothetical protein
MVKGMASCVAAGALYSRCHNHPTAPCQHHRSEVGNVGRRPPVSFACGSPEVSQVGEKREWDASSADGGDRIGWLHHQLQVGNVGMKPLVSISCRSLEVPQVKVGQRWDGWSADGGDRIGWLLKVRLSIRITNNPYNQ